MSDHYSDVPVASENLVYLNRVILAAVREALTRDRVTGQALYGLSDEDADAVLSMSYAELDALAAEAGPLFRVLGISDSPTSRTQQRLRQQLQAIGADS